MKTTRSALVLCACALSCSIASATFLTARQKMAQVEVLRLLFVGQGKPPDPIKLKVGEVLQIEPFTYPVIPAFLDATLKAQLTGDRALELIGQLPTSSAREGRSGRSAFFLAVKEGRTRASLTLVDGQGRPIEGFDLSYVIDVAS